MKTVTIIGAGISGLVAGVYAQRSGFKTTILEKAANPGGISTSWKRKGYTFEGGIHWLIGASERNPLHNVWKDTGALGDNNPVFFKDPVYTLIDGDVTLELSRDLRSLVNFAPEDRFFLGILRFHVWCFSFFHQPMLDLPGLKVRRPKRFSLLEFIKMGPAVLLAPWLLCFSARKYIRRFRNPYVRKLLEGVVDPEINALSLIYTLSTFYSGDSGYPEGGSLRMARNMADTFTRLGGVIRYQTPVTCVTPEGVMSAEGLVKSDAVVISVDARTAIDKLFPSPLQERWARRMRAELVTSQCMFAALGVRCTLPDYPRAMQLALKKPFKAAGLCFDRISVNNYSREGEAYAPAGCTVLTSVLPGSCYEYWKKEKEEGRYAEAKKKVLEDFIEAVCSVILEIRCKVEVTDLATPLSYQRYCDTFEGSYMSDWLPLRIPPVAPIRYRDGIYFTGQRTSFSGGLPVAAESGRQTIQALCKDFGMEFVNEAE